MVDLRSVFLACCRDVEAIISAHLLRTGAISSVFSTKPHFLVGLQSAGSPRGGNSGSWRVE